MGERDRRSLKKVRGERGKIVRNDGMMMRQKQEWLAIKVSQVRRDQNANDVELF